ncbi:MAG: tRNA 2-thiouridine(34) synthase MnmA [Patescibacteria group bacterium]|nr:tRNA 2-thiouridine(34) synthase MnmA [Patescibacteria group bacterium]
MSGQKRSKGKVCVGLSGGVDSAVSAALLKQQGFDVTGVFIRIAIGGYPCSAGEDALWAKRVAAHLDIPYREVDLSKEYEAEVFRVSMAEFAKGKTPNPDALCNREIKFGVFFDWCVAHGADYVATGHYAQTKDGALLMSADTEKDQTYFLWAVPETKLCRTMFPVGHLLKTQVRALATKLGLPNAQRKDSQGLCFLGGITLGDALARELTLTPGDVLDESGSVVGRHGGVYAYTIGQRHGFELFAAGPRTQPHYVAAKDPEFNSITVSTQRTPATATEITLTEQNWIGAHEDGPCAARVRHRGALIPAQLRGNVVVLEEPQYVAEGQSLVVYLPDGKAGRDNPLRQGFSEASRCIGGGIIEKVSWPSSSLNQTAGQNRSNRANL